jgi:hypothetical protein
MEFFYTILRFLHKFSYKMEKLIGIITIKGAKARFLHTPRPLLQILHFRARRPYGTQSAIQKAQGRRCSSTLASFTAANSGWAVKVNATLIE